MTAKTTSRTAALALLLVGSLAAAEGISVPDSPRDIRPLLIGAALPGVTLRSASGEPITLAEAAGGQPTVLIFYRGGWCPYCNRHLGQLQSAEADLVTLGYRIIAISPDRPAKLQESREKGAYTYTLLSDSRVEAARAFGIAFRLDDATVAKYKTYKIDLDDASGESHHVLPVPAVFVVNAEGVIVFSYINPDYRTRLAPEVLVAAAKAALPPEGK